MSIFVFFVKKGVFFWFNLIVIFLYVILLLPLFNHLSSEHFLLGYSRSYLIYLCVLTMPVVVIIPAVILNDGIFNKRIFMVIVVSFFCAEVFTRLLMRNRPYQETDDYRYPAPFIMFAGKPGAVFVDRTAKAMGYTANNDSSIRLNGLGFRGDKPIIPKDSGEIRIFVLGGSTVFNGVPLSESISGYMESLACTDGYKKVKVYNWGVVSSVSGQELSIILNRVVDYQPDIVVVYDGGNDIMVPYNYDPRPGYTYNFLVYEEALKVVEGKGSILDMSRRLALKSCAVRVIFSKSINELFTEINSLKKNAGYGTAGWKEEICKNYVSNIDKMCHLSQGFNFKLAFFLQPLVYFKSPLIGKEIELSSPTSFMEYVKEQYANTQLLLGPLKKKYSNNSNIMIEDLTGIFRGYGKEVYWDYIHTTNEGNSYIAENIYERLKSSNFIPNR